MTGSADNSLGSGAPRTFATRHRRIARSVLGGLALVGVMSLVASLLSYRIDVDEAERELGTRADHDAQLYADALSIHVGMLAAELRRVALRPEVDLEDGSSAPEELLLEHTHSNSALFNGGVALIDRRGIVLSQVPGATYQVGEDLSGRPWFQRALLSGALVVGRVNRDDGMLVICVPIGPIGAPSGYLAGLLREPNRLLPAELQRGERVIVIDSATREVAFELAGPRGEVPALWGDLLRDRRLDKVEVTSARQGDFNAVAAPIRPGLELVLLSDRSQVIAPIRLRLIDQLVLLASLQLLTLSVFLVFLRRTHRDLLRLETQVAQHQKMASLGLAASLIAHEVKNALNGINAATTLATRPDDAALAAHVIRSQTTRLSHLARSLLAFGKPVSARLGPTDVARLTREIVDQLRALPEAAAVRISLDVPPALFAEADPSLLGTALDNLVRNAIEAAAAALDTGRTATATLEVRAHAVADRIELVVEDHAGGPPEGFEARLFEPFATTKSKGVGLGLVTARQAIEAQAGMLRFERIPGGSRFSLQLKAAQLETVAAPLSAPGDDTRSAAGGAR